MPAASQLCMKDRIRQLAEGQVVTTLPELSFSPEHFDGPLAPGMVHTREIIVRSRNAALFKAFFSSTDGRVRVSTRQAVGHSAVIVLEIDTRQLDVRRITGEVIVVTIAGEQHIPYDFVVESDDSQAPVPQTVEELAGLALREPELTARLFGTREFERKSGICRDGALQALRRGLLVGSSEQQALESFLVECKAKKPMAVSLEEPTGSFEIKDLYTEGEIHLAARGSGLIRGIISSDSEWLCPRKLRITQKDFELGRASVPFTLDSLRMHAGLNLGRVIIRIGNQKLTYEVSALRRRVQKKTQIRRMSDTSRCRLLRAVCGLILAEKGDLIQLFRNTGTEEKKKKWEEYAQILEAAVKEAPGDLNLQLANVWFLLECERGPEAKRILEWCAREISRKSEGAEAESVLLKYLAGMLLKDDRMKKEALAVAHQLWEIRGGLAEGLMEIYLVRGAKPEEELELLTGLGSKYPQSAILSALTARCIARNPKALKQTDDFIVRVLVRLQKNRSLSAAAIERFLTLDLERITSRRPLVRLLDGIYKVTADRRALGIICTELIQAETVSRKELEWLSEGVRREIAVNGLYDACITAAARYSADIALPESLLYYYSYKITLGRDARLYLYTYLCAHCPTDSDLYRAYEDQMTKFAIRSLLEGKPEPGLADIYDKILIPEFVDEHMAGIVPDLLYSHRISTGDKNAVRVVIHYPELTREFSAQLVAGAANVPVYTDSAAILFENENGLRYCAPYKKQRLMERDQLLAYCRKKRPDQLMLSLSDIQKLYTSGIDSPQLLTEARRLLAEPDISSFCRRLLEERLLDWCRKTAPADSPDAARTIREQSGMDQAAMGMDAWLGSLSLKDRPAEQVRDIAVQNALRGNMRAAEAALRVTGTENIPQAILEKIAVAGITERGGAYQEELFDLCRNLEKTKNKEILSYLCHYMEADTARLEALYKSAAAAGAQRYDLSQRLLMQKLFAGETERLEEALSAWLSDGGKDETIQLACLCVKAHEAVTNGRVPDEGTGESICSAIREGSSSEVLELALLLYYSGLPELDGQQKKSCEGLVYRMCMEDRYHPCFHDLAHHIALPHQMEGRVIIQASAEPGKRLFADISAEAEVGSARSSRRLMTEIYPGIYTAPVFLFPDEHATVSVSQGKNLIMEPFTVDSTRCCSRSGSVYDSLKELLALYRQNRQEDWIFAFERYMRRNKTAEDLFPLYEDEAGREDA